MTALWIIPPINLRTPGVMTATELAAWAKVGKNTVPRLVQHFGLRAVTGHAKNRRYSVLEITRKLLEVTPESPDDLDLLLAPLQKASWVSAVTGLSVSAINAAVCEKRGDLPAQIEAHLRGDPIPFLPCAAPVKIVTTPRPSNVFEQIVASNAEEVLA